LLVLSSLAAGSAQGSSVPTVHAYTSSDFKSPHSGDLLQSQLFKD